MVQYLVMASNLAYPLLVEELNLHYGLRCGHININGLYGKDRRS